MSKIIIGNHGKRNIFIDLVVLLWTRLLIQSNSGGGKSWLLRRLIEMAFGKVQIIVIDPEGEFATLREKYGFVLVGKGGETPADCRSAALVAHKLLELGASAICDLYEMKASDRHRWVRIFLEAMVDAPKHLWRPVLFIIDEGHQFAPEKGAGESEASDAVIAMATRGRKRGFGLAIATQRLGKLRKDVAAELMNVMVGMTFIDIDRKRAAETLGIPPSDMRKFNDDIKMVEPGNFWMLGRAISKDRVLVKVGAIETTHPEPGSSKHAAAPPPPPEKIRALLPKLKDLPQEADAKAKTESDLRLEVHQLKKQVATLSAHKDWTVEKKVEVEKRVEVPVLKDSQIKQLEKSVDRFVEACGKTGSLATAIKEILMKSFAREFGSGKKPIVIDPAKPFKSKINVNEMLNLHAGHPKYKAEIVTGEPKDGEIPRPQLVILKALADFAAIGRTEIPRTWVAARSGVSVKSSTFQGNLGALRSIGFIEYNGSGDVRITTEGSLQVGPSERPMTTEEMFKSCLDVVSEQQVRILRELYEHYPNLITRDDLAERVGVSPNSSTYQGNLGSLRSVGMIEKRRDTSEKLSDWIYID